MGGEHDRVDVAVVAGRRAHGDLLDPRRLRGDGAHHDGAGVGRPSAGDIDSGAADRYLSQRHGLPLRKFDGAVGAQSRERHRPHVSGGELERLAQRAGQRGQRLVEL